MEPKFVDGNVKADCPVCGVPTTFEYRHPSVTTEFGHIIVDSSHRFRGDYYEHIIFKLLRCSVCSRPGVATVHVKNNYRTESALESFWPTGIPHEKIPNETPHYIGKELREAENSMSIEAWRAAAAMLRSTLEKTLIANGYEERTLYEKIEAAGENGIITSARRQRAQDLVRTLGNDVLHEKWREVKRGEVEDAHKYVARIIEDFYDDRATVLKALEKKGRKVHSEKEDVDEEIRAK
jgi:hypothetical protein